MLTIGSCKAQTNNNNLMQKKIEVFDIKGYYERSKEPEYEGYYKEDNTYVRQFGDSLSGFVEYETSPSLEEVFQIYRRFYPNGSLMLKGLNFPNDFEKGIWKEYDEQGNLIKETDYDKGFDYTWEDLLKLLKKREVDIKDTDNTTIRKEDGNWRFSYVKGIYIHDVIIHGKTGKVIQDAKNVFQEGS